MAKINNGQTKAVQLILVPLANSTTLMEPATESPAGQGTVGQDPSRDPRTGSSYAILRAPTDGALARLAERRLGD